MTSSKATSWIPGYIALGITWGSSFLFIKWGLLTLTPLGVAFFRSFIGGVTLLIYAALTKQKLPTKFSELRHLVVVALLLNAIPGFLFGVGETKVSSITAGIINATTPLMTVLVITLAFREQKINLNQWLGIILGFIGVLFVTNIFGDQGHNSVTGILILLAATFCYGVSFPYSKRYISKLPYSSTALATAQISTSAVLLLPFILIFPVKTDSWNSKSIAGMLLLGAVGTGFAYVWNFRNVKLAGSTIASTVTYVTPVVAVALGFLLLDEKIALIQLIGGILILLSATLVQERIKLIKK